MDGYFLAMGEPAHDMVVPDGEITNAVDDPEQTIKVGASWGIRVLTPEGARKALPLQPTTPGEKTQSGSALMVMSQNTSKSIETRNSIMRPCKLLKTLVGPWGLEPQASTGVKVDLIHSEQWLKQWKIGEKSRRGINNLQTRYA
jgi:hypothetical protein